MRKLKSLIKTDLITTFRLTSLKDKRDKLQLGFMILALISLGPSYGLLVKGITSIYSGFELLGQEHLFLFVGFFISQMFVFIFGILYAMSKFYFSNDLEVLVPLPIKASTIISSKFISLLINEYLTSILIIAPFIITYGIKANIGPLYWFYSILDFLLLPIIPLSLATIIVMFLMKYTNIKGKKDLFRIIGFILLIVVIITVQLKLQSLSPHMVDGGEDYLVQLLKEKNTLINNLGRSFPPSIWATLALSESSNISGFLYLLIFSLVSILFFVLLSFLSEKIFFDGLIGNKEVSKSSGKIGKLGESMFISRKPYLSIFSKEAKLLLRTPIYLLNTLGGVVIVPIILVITNFMGDSSSDLEPIVTLIESKPFLVTLFGIGFVCLLGIMNSVGSTTFSREGKCFWIPRSVPVDVKDQIIGRVLSSLFIQLIGIFVLIICMLFIVKVTVWNVLGILIFGLLGSIPVTMLGMIVDIQRPLLKWDNPQKAMKENLNVLISMGLGTLFLFGIGALVYILLGKLKWSIIIIYVLLTLIFIVSSCILFTILKNISKRQFINIK